MQISKIICLALICVSTTLLRSQHSRLYSKLDWDKVVLDKNYNPTPNDTCLIFASVRSCAEAEKIFMGYDCDKNITTRFFNIYFNKNKWICVPKKNLSDCLKGKEDMEAITFVEGFGYTFLKALDRATLLSRQYGALIIMFDWPTYRPQLKTIKNYKITKAESEKISIHFATFLDSLSIYGLAHKKAFRSSSMILHSMGNLLMMHAIKNNYIKTKDTLFDAIILNAACTPQKNHKAWVEKISIQKRLYITRNNRDGVLASAKWMEAFKKQLGERPRRPYADNALYIDFSRVLGREHNYFLYPSVLNQYPYIKSLYRSIFLGAEPDFSNENRYIKKPKKHAIEIFDLNEAQKGGIGISIGG